MDVGESRVHALDFVTALLESGRVRVPASPDVLGGLAQAVQELDHLARPELAFDAPALVPAAGEWALLLLYRGCQALVHREIEAGAVRAALSRPCPAPPSPGACYSADLALRFLPDLLRLARGIAEDDPLVEGLRTVARAWPLSSVGAGQLGELDVTPFIDHPSLRRLYADRVIERADLSRPDHPAVREAVRAALGAFPQLAPRVAAALAQEEPQTCP